EPFGDEFAARMEVDRLERTGTDVGELMWRVCRRDEGFACRRDDHLIAQREAAGALAYDEGLGIGMGVQARPATRPRDIVEDDANIAAMLSQLHFALPVFWMLGPVFALDQLRHGFTRGPSS